MPASLSRPLRAPSALPRCCRACASKLSPFPHGIQSMSRQLVARLARHAALPASQADTGDNSECPVPSAANPAVALCGCSANMAPECLQAGGTPSSHPNAARPVSPPSAHLAAQPHSSQHHGNAPHEQRSVHPQPCEAATPTTEAPTNGFILKLGATSPLGSPATSSTPMLQSQLEMIATSDGARRQESGLDGFPIEVPPIEGLQGPRSRLPNAGGGGHAWGGRGGDQRASAELETRAGDEVLLAACRRAVPRSVAP